MKLSELSFVGKKREAKCLRFKTITIDVRNTIVPSFMFLFNLSMPVVLSVMKMHNTIFTTESMK